MSRKSLSKFLSIFMLLSMMVGMAAPVGVLASVPEAVPVQETDALDKIEPLVLTQMEASGQTDFFIWMTEKADLSPAYDLATKAEKGQFVFDTLRATAARTQAALRGQLDKSGVEYRPYYISNKILVSGGNQTLLMGIAARPDVARITANHTIQLDEPFKSPEGPSPLAIETNITFINADDVWALGYDGSGTVMAGNDTGLDETHPTIAPHYRGCIDPPTCSTWDHNYNWWDATGTYATNPFDGHGHGTHTTGTMVGDDGGANQIGVAPGAQTVHCKNMTDGGGGSDATFTECFEWDLAPWDLSYTGPGTGNPNPALAPDAVNNSWGYLGGGQNQFRDEVQALHAAGILVEVSAGNEGSSGCSTLRSPGDYWETLTTGSVNHSGGTLPGTITGFSSRGPSSLDGNYFPDIMAPGENIRSSMPGNSYTSWGGTSMSGPHATALVGLMWNACPAFRGDVYGTIDIIHQTAVPLTGQNGSNCGGDYTTGPNNDWGMGTIDALAAVNAIIGLCAGQGALAGTVTDGLLAANIEGATITAARMAGGAWNDDTDVSGYYTMTIPNGTYTVTAEHPQYTTEEVYSVLVVTNTLTIQDFDLDARGMLYGYVTDYDNGFPLEATVTADDGTTTTTNPATGYYEMYLDAGSYVITASVPDYADGTASVTIVSGVDTQEDFVLQAAVAFTPSPVHVTLDMGAIDTTVVTLTNRMASDYDFEFREVSGGFVPVSILAFDGELPESNVPTSMGPAPDAPQLTGETPPMAFPLAGEPAFAMDVYPGENLVNIPDTTVPGTWNVIGNIAGSQYFAGDFVGGDFSTLYTLDYGANSLYAVDTATAVPTLIGASAPGGGESWSGMTGAADGTLYASGTTCSASTLYTIDPATGTPTAVGAISNGPCIIDIAINAAGEMYGVDIVGDVLVQIDPATGAGTVIGSLGVGANYAQGMDFEEVSGVLYWAAYTTQGELRVIDTTTGASTLVGAFPSGAETDCLAFPTGGASDNVPWFSEDPITGTVSATSDLNATLYFSATAAAGIDQPGDYYAALKVAGTPSVQVPVTMTVNAPATWGQLNGTVTGLGYCDVDPAALEDAEVFITDSGGVTYTLMTDVNGYFTHWFDAAVSPLDILVTFPEHTDGSATGVVITAGGTTTEDFDLRLLQPCTSVAPDSLETTLDMGDSTVLTLDIDNTGSVSTTFGIVEKSGGYDPLMLGASDVEIISRERLAGYDENAMSTKGVLSDGGTQPANILAAGDVLAQWSTGHTLNWGDGFDLDAGTVWINDNAAGGGSGLNEEFDVSGTLTGASFTPSFGGSWPGDMAYNPNSGMFWQVNVGGDNCLYEWDPSIPAATGNTICSTAWAISQRGVAYDPVGDTYFVGGWNDDTIWHIDSSGALIDSWGFAGGISGLAYNFEAGLLFIQENSSTDAITVVDVGTWTIVDSFAAAGFGSNAGAGLAIDCDGNLWAPNQGDNNAYLIDSGVPASLCASDVPWLSEDPITGTLAADTGAQTIDVTFDAGVPEIGQPGVYYATLKVDSDDPLAPLNVPVTMTVNTPADWGRLDGTVTGLGYCDVDPAGLEGAELLITDSGGVTYTLMTDANGYFSYWFDEVVSPLDIAVTFPEYTDGSATGVAITAGVTTTVDFDLRWLEPCVSVDPVAMEVTLSQGYSTTLVLDIDNAGAVSTTFELAEKPGGFMLAAPLVGEDMLVVNDGDSASATAIETALTDLGYTWLEVDTTTFAAMSIADLLEYQAVLIAAGWSIDDHDAHMMAYLDAGGSLFIADNDLGYQYSGGGVFYNTYLQATYVSDSGSDGVVVGMDIMAGISTDISADPYPDDFTAGAEGVGIFQAPSGNLAGIQVERMDYKAIYLAWEYEYTGAVEQTPIMEAALNFLAISGDIPWLSEDPITGTVSADSVFNIDVTFDTMTYTLGTYTGTLMVKSDDPINDTVEVPVTMYVVDVLTYGVELSGDDAQSGDPGDVIAYTLSVTNTGNIADTYAITISDTWGASAPASIMLNAGATGTFDVAVPIPAGAAGGDFDVAAVTVTSVVSPTATDSADLTTTANAFYGVELSGDDAQSGDPGDVIAYTLSVTNTGNTVDTFTIAVSDTWGASAPASIMLNAGATGMFDVLVPVPAGAAGGDFDVAAVTVTSVVSPIATDSADLTTTANAFYGVELSGDDAQSGDPGDVVTYTLSVTNTGNAPDTFTIAISDTWGASAPVSVTLNASATGTFDVAVPVPAGAAGGDFDVATVTVTSVTDSAATDSADLTTTANAFYGVELSGDDAQSGDPGDVVTYTLSVTNTGNTVDTFTIAVSDVWGASAPASIMLNAGATGTFDVAVPVPAGAMGGDFDVATVTVTSVTDNAATDSADLTTTAVVTEYLIYLPLLTK